MPNIAALITVAAVMFAVSCIKAQKEACLNPLLKVDSVR